jgi:hypothetical protein
MIRSKGVFLGLIRPGGSDNIGRANEEAPNDTATLPQQSRDRTPQSVNGSLEFYMI